MPEQFPKIYKSILTVTNLDILYIIAHNYICSYPKFLLSNPGYINIYKFTETIFIGLLYWYDQFTLACTVLYYVIQANTTIVYCIHTGQHSLYPE